MDDPSSSTSATFSAEKFFETQEPPPKLAHLLEGVKEFVTRHAREGRRVVLVTVRNASEVPTCCTINPLMLAVVDPRRVVVRLSRWNTMCEHDRASQFMLASDCA